MSTTTTAEERCLAGSILLFMFFASCCVSAKLPTPPVFPSSPHYPAQCYLPPESALCNPKEPANVLPSFGNFGGEDRSTRGDSGGESLLTRYYFDVSTEQCYPFGAQNCGGNENRFETKAECMATCRIRNSATNGDSSF